MIDWFEWAVEERENQARLNQLEGYDHIGIIRGEMWFEGATIPNWKIEYKYPPPIPEESEIIAQADGLFEIVNSKVTELLERDGYLAKKYTDWKKAFKKLQKTKKYSQFSIQAFLFELEKMPAEREMISKWLHYWLSIYEKLPKPKKDAIRYERYYDSLDKKEQVERIKQDRSIESLYTGQLRGTGTRLQGKCPFHEEKTASFFVYTNDNTWHCYGACGTGGDVISFIMKRDGITFPEAIEILR